MHEKVKLKTYKFTLSPLFHQTQLDMARKVEVLLMCGDLSGSLGMIQWIYAYKLIKYSCAQRNMKWIKHETWHLIGWLYLPPELSAFWLKEEEMSVEKQLVYLWEPITHGINDPQDNKLN